MKAKKGIFSLIPLLIFLPKVYGVIYYASYELLTSSLYAPLSSPQSFFPSLYFSTINPAYPSTQLEDLATLSESYTPFSQTLFHFVGMKKFLEKINKSIHIYIQALNTLPEPILISGGYETTEIISQMDIVLALGISGKFFDSKDIKSFGAHIKFFVKNIYNYLFIKPLIDIGGIFTLPIKVEAIKKPIFAQFFIKNISYPDKVYDIMYAPPLEIGFTATSFITLPYKNLDLPLNIGFSFSIPDQLEVEINGGINYRDVKMCLGVNIQNNDIGLQLLTGAKVPLTFWANLFISYGFRLSLLSFFTLHSIDITFGI